MRRITLSIGLALLLLFSGMALQAGELDGKTFVGSTGKTGKAKGDADTFTFAGGRFRSLACDKYGFGDAPYTAKQEGAKTTFEAETKSAKQGTMKWAGTVEGDTLTGTAVWKKGTKKPVDYWVKAKAKS